jgi:hypothetical protein
MTINPNSQFVKGNPLLGVVGSNGVRGLYAPSLTDDLLPSAFQTHPLDFSPHRPVEDPEQFSDRKVSVEVYLNLTVTLRPLQALVSGLSLNSIALLYQPVKGNALGLENLVSSNRRAVRVSEDVAQW